MRSRSCLLSILLLTLSIANAASAGPTDGPPASDSVASDTAAEEAVTLVRLDLDFERVIARIDRDIAAMLQPTAMDCSSGAGASGVELCVVRLEPAIAAVGPAAPAPN